MRNHSSSNPARNSAGSHPGKNDRVIFIAVSGERNPSSKNSPKVSQLLRLPDWKPSVHILMNIHETIVTWAAKADPKFNVAPAYHTFCPMELCLSTRAILRIKDPVLRTTFLLDITVPHERRTASYIMGPDQDNDLREPLYFFVPDFSCEESLRRALDIVHKRFLTEYGGQRFEDPARESAPDILATAQAWADWKDCGIRVSQNDGNQPASVLVFIPSQNSKRRGIMVGIHPNRAVSQNILDPSNPGLNAVCGYLPPFFTASELRGALESAFDVRNSA